MTMHRSDTAPGSDEQYVRDVIDSAMSGTRPPVDLPASALARGRRLRTRHRATYAVAGIAASLALAVGVPWLTPGSDRSVRGGDLVATQPPAPLPEAPLGWWDMPATDMVDAVRAIAPDAVTVTDPGPLEADTLEGGPAAGWVRPGLQGPAGPGALNVMLHPGPVRSATVDGEGTVVAPSCGVERSTDRIRCEDLLDADGEVVGRRLSERWDAGVVINEVVLHRDGGTVYAASANTLDDKWDVDSPVSAPRPPMTLDDLENLVRNDVWVSYEP